MKTAYELAMERLSKTAPAVKLTPEQKRQIAELESRCTAKIAEREIALRDEIAKATEAGDGDKIAELEERLIKERKKLQSELEEKKAQVRNSKG
jgi:septin family protein